MNASEGKFPIIITELSSELCIYEMQEMQERLIRQAQQINEEKFTFDERSYGISGRLVKFDDNNEIKNWFTSYQSIKLVKTLLMMMLLLL